MRPQTAQHATSGRLLCLELHERTVSPPSSSSLLTLLTTTLSSQPPRVRESDWSRTLVIFQLIHTYSNVTIRTSHFTSSIFSSHSFRPRLNATHILYMMSSPRLPFGDKFLHPKPGRERVWDDNKWHAPFTLSQTRHTTPCFVVSFLYCGILCWFSR